MTDQPRVHDPNVPSSLALGPDLDHAAAGGAHTIDRALPGDSGELLFEYGLEIEARSQWGYARRRFMQHRLALASVIVLAGIFGCGIFANVHRTVLVQGHSLYQRRGLERDRHQPDPGEAEHQAPVRY